jgi:hypothetical protein
MLFRIKGKMNGAKYIAILNVNLLPGAQDLRLVAKFHLPTGQRPEAHSQDKT